MKTNLITLLVAMSLSWAMLSLASVAPKQINTETQYCPSIKSLKKVDALWWEGPGDWKSYSESFVREISYFSGAQWVGINVGKIICLYQGKQQGMFPVTLELELLVPSPTGGKWSKDQGGYKNCASTVIADCSFRVEAPKPIEDIYQLLESFKK